MRRREFITILGGAAAAWPLAAHPQQPNGMRRIAVLSSGNADDQLFKSALAAFQQGLQQLGWTDGRNVRIDLRPGRGDLDNIRKHASELAALAPDIIMAVGGSAVGPLLQATRTVPIVFVFAPDPVGSGFVNSLSRPGGNATGFMAFEYSLSAKWLELLKEIAPGVKRAAVLWDSAIAAGIGQFAVIQSVAPSLGVEVNPVNLRDVEQGGSGLRTLWRWRPDRDGERFGGGSARFDRRTCGPAQTACGLQLPRLCRCRRLDLL